MTLRTSSSLGSAPFRTQKLDDRVYEAICEAIITGALQSGERLREAEVAEALGVSRTPVRAAFARLERQYLLEVLPSGAYHVAHWDTRTLWEVATLRAALESLAITLASERFTDDDYQSLESVLAQMRAATARGQTERLADLDTEFHVCIWSRCGHALLQDALETMKPKIRYFVRLTPPLSEYDYTLYHQQLIDLMRTGSAEEQGDCMREHILMGASARISMLEQSGGEITGAWDWSKSEQGEKTE